MTTQKNHFVAKRIRQALTMISLNSALVSFLLLSLYASAEVSDAIDANLLLITY